MRIKTVSVVYERKFNMGDYQSLNVGVTLWADLDYEHIPDSGTVVVTEDEDEVVDKLFTAAKQAVRKQFLMAKGKWNDASKDGEQSDEIYEEGE